MQVMPLVPLCHGAIVSFDLNSVDVFIVVQPLKRDDGSVVYRCGTRHSFLM